MEEPPVVVEVPEYSNNRKSPFFLEEEELRYLESDRFRKKGVDGKPKETFVVHDHVDRKTKEPKHYIENTSYAGIIELHDKLRIVFSTKVATNLFYLLRFAKKDPDFHFDDEKKIDIKGGENFFDIIGMLFANEIKEILQTGLLKRYVQKHENLHFLKGKLDIRKQLYNNIHKKLKFACCFSELTFDNQENRIVLRALYELSSLIKFDYKLRDELIATEYLFRDFVSFTAVSPQECDNISFNRINERYRAIIRFSKLILEERFIRSAEKGESTGFNFIVNMNKVFEDFITELLKEVIRDKYHRKYIAEDQVSFSSLDIAKKLTVRPDVLIQERNTEEFPVILDTKYKKPGKKPDPADYYQIIAYALAIPSAKTCCLLYPKDLIEGNELPNQENFEHLVVPRDLQVLSKTLKVEPKDIKEKDKIEIYVRFIDLYIENTIGYEDYIKKMKEQMKGILDVLLPQAGV